MDEFAHEEDTPPSLPPPLAGQVREHPAKLDKPGRSTGPRTPAGKAKSSLNRLTHGMRSEKTVLRDEDPAEFEATVQGWIDTYHPQDDKEDNLVSELAHAHWLLKRARKRVEEIEWNLPGNAWNWTDEHQKLYANFSRYKTTAERSFLRWYKEMESHRGRQFREEQIREKARLAAAAIEVKWLSKEEANTTKKLKATQIVEIEIEDGECITSLYPSNEELLETYGKFETPPLFIKRLLLFPDGIPPEYSWTDPKRLQKSEYLQAAQNMRWSRWLEVIAREETLDTGHVGPMFTGPK